MNGSTIIPSARYHDAHAAIEWLCSVFGFARHAVYESKDGKSIDHAELTLDGGMFMLGSYGKHGAESAAYEKGLISLEETGGRETVSLCLIVKDCDAVYARAKAANATIVQELNSPEYGGKSFSCKDTEGHIWWVGSYNPWATK